MWQWFLLMSFFVWVSLGMVDSAWFSMISCWCLLIFLWLFNDCLNDFLWSFAFFFILVASLWWYFCDYYMIVYAWICRNGRGGRNKGGEGNSSFLRFRWNMVGRIVSCFRCLFFRFPVFVFGIRLFVLSEFVWFSIIPCCFFVEFSVIV